MDDYTVMVICLDYFIYPLARINCLSNAEIVSVKAWRQKIYYLTMFINISNYINKIFCFNLKS